MLFAYKEFIKKPNANILNKTLIDKFRCVAKELQIILKYDPSGRRCKSKLTDAESSKGCWVNCRFKTDTEKQAQKKNEIESKPEIDVIISSDNEIKELERQIDELKRLLTEKYEKINEIKKKQEGEVEVTTEELYNIDIEEQIIEDDEEEIQFENIYEEKQICDEINNLMSDMIYTTELRADHIDFNWEEEDTINEDISNLLKNIDENSLKNKIIPHDLIRNYDILDLENDLANY